MNKLQFLNINSVYVLNSFSFHLTSVITLRNRHGEVGSESDLVRPAKVQQDMEKFNVCCARHSSSCWLCQVVQEIFILLDS